MNRLANALEKIAEDLAEHHMRWCLVGGLAVSAHVEPRFTRDIDIAVHVANDQEAEQLGASLRQAGYTILAVVEQKATGRLATVRLVPPGQDAAGVVVDLLFASSGIEAELVREAATISIFAGSSVPVAQPPDLLALKLLSRDPVNRPQDELDLRALLTVVSQNDIAAVCKSLRLITERGYGRGRELLKELDDFLAQTGHEG